MRRYFEVCRLTYNACLEHRRQRYAESGESVSEFELNKLICEWRNGDKPWMLDCGVAILHDVSRRVEKAFKGFFRRVKAGGEAPGFPRFKGEGRIRSFTNPRFSYKIKGRKIRLTNDIGWVKIKEHRKVLGEPKGYTVSVNACGDWFISVWVETPAIHRQPIDRSNNVGIDLGCSELASLSDGTVIRAPKFYKKKEKELGKAQRKGRKDAAAKIHKKIRNQRKDFLHKTSNFIVENYDIIFAEKLKVKSIDRKTFKTVRKSVRDNGWNQFANFLSYKAASAGKTFGTVDPAYTSQTCSNCGKRHHLELGDRIMDCGCGYRESRDINAARNILSVGLHGLGISPRSPRL